MSGRFTIRNGSGWPDAEVRALIKFGMSECDVRGVCVNVKRATGNLYRGRAYESIPYESNAPARAENLIVIAVGEGLTYPARPWRFRRGEPRFVLHDWRETTVFVAAHEAKHIEQFREGKPRSEVACNNFAYYMLERYREEVAA